MVVWSLPLPAGSEGPSLIPCAARLRSVGHHGLPPVPSWHTIIARPARARLSRARITKAGNRRCRHVLVQAAWSYRGPPHVGAALKKRQEGQPAQVIAHSWKAQHGLHKLFRRIAYRKNNQTAVVAVAREMVGFLWAVMQELESRQVGGLDQAA